jgi:hypothetical protein
MVTVAPAGAVSGLKPVIDNCAKEQGNTKRRNPVKNIQRENEVEFFI